MYKLPERGGGGGGGGGGKFGQCPKENIFFTGGLPLDNLALIGWPGGFT